MYSNMENISNVVSKKSEKKFFSTPQLGWPLPLVSLVGGLEKNFFSDFFETTLEMFSILEYIGQI